MLTSYQDRIAEQYASLTKGMKKVADALLNDPTIFAAQSAKKVGEALGVSETMVVRLSYSLGYQGYSELQQDVRQAVYNIYTDVHDLQATGQAQDEQLPYYRQAMRLDQVNIDKVSKSLSDQQLNLAIDRLDGADQVLVTGLNFGFSMAHWLSFSLNSIKGNCRLYRPEEHIHLNYFNEQSVVVVFSFYRYLMEPLWIAEEAKKKGIYVIAFTDYKAAPVIPHADLVFTLDLPSRSIIQMSPVIFSLLNVIIMEIANRNEGNVKQIEEQHINKFYIP